MPCSMPKNFHCSPEPLQGIRARPWTAFFQLPYIWLLVDSFRWMGALMWPPGSKLASAFIIVLVNLPCIVQTYTLRK